MPYLEPGSIRNNLDFHIDQMMSEITCLTPGIINRIVCRVALTALRRAAVKDYGFRSALIAAIDDAHDELKRRLLFPYEDKKAAENGDLFEEFGFGDGK